MWRTLRLLLVVGAVLEFAGLPAIADEVKGDATFSRGFSRDSEIWVEPSGDRAKRIFANGDTTVEYEDGKVALYLKVQKKLREDVRSNGPRPVVVSTSAGGVTATKVKLLPRKKIK